MVNHYQKQQKEPHLYHVTGHCVDSKGNKVEFQANVQACDSKEAASKAKKHCKLSGRHYIEFRSVQDKGVIC